MKHNPTIRGLGILLIALCLFTAPVSAAPGDLDATFSLDGKTTDGVGKSGPDNAYATALQPDGKILVAGDVRYGDYIACGVARYNPNGSLDTTFDYDGKAFIYLSKELYYYCRDIALQPDGKIILAGHNSGVNIGDFVISRLNSNGSLDTTFDGDGKATTPIGSSFDHALSVAIQADGKIVAAGDSYSGTTASSAFALVRYNSDGSLDTTFDGDGKVTTAIGSSYDSISDIALQADGKIVAVGNSVTSSRNVILRYNTDGSLDSTFSPANTPLPAGHEETVYAVAIQTDGKIVASGSTHNGTQNDFSVTRYNPNGSLDTTFDGDGKAITPMSPTGQDSGSSIALSADGKILVGGYVISGSAFQFAMARYNTDGSLDATFDGDGKLILSLPNSTVAAADQLIIQPDGKILALSPSSYDGQVFHFALVRLNQTAALDTTFNLTGVKVTEVGYVPGAARATAIAADGKIVVAGSGSNLLNDDFALVRYNTDGLIDPTFGNSGRVLTPISNGADVINAVAIQTDGKIVVGGTASNGVNLDYAVVRYNADGTLDTSFGTGGKITLAIGNGDDILTAMIIQPDGKIVVGGYIRNGAEGQIDFMIVRLGSNGGLDATFSGDGVAITTFSNADRANALALQSDGKIIAAGMTSTGNEDYMLVRYNANGSLDTTFDGDGIVTTAFVAGSSDVINAVGVQPDGKIVAAGGGFNLARYNADGSLDASFGSGGKVMPGLPGGFRSASALSIRPNGAIVVAGSRSETFPIVNDFTIFRFTPTGAFDATFSGDGMAMFDLENGSSDTLNAMAFDTSGRAVVAGTSNGLFAVARVVADGARGSVPFDFDGDRKSDLSVFRSSNGAWYIQQSTAGFAGVGFGLAGDKLAPGDYDGDGKTDFAVVRSGNWYIQRSQLGFTSVSFGGEGNIPTPADFDGDGKTDIAVFRPIDGTWYLLQSTGGFRAVAFGQANDRPVAADYDGDGKADIAVFRPSTGDWHILKSSNSSYMGVNFGTQTDNAVPADYTGDGKADIAVFRPSTGAWYVLRSEDNSFYAAAFGANGDVPVAADYDGDGKADFAVFRAGTWYINRSTAGFLGVGFGIGTDNPIPAAFVQ